MITIGFCNLKGGVGKTTACQNIAVALAKKDYRVAVVDMDPQSNLSAGFGVTPKETEAQVFDLLSGGASWDDIVCRKEGVDIIPSCLKLAMAELNDQSPVTRNTALRDALKKVAPDRYDFILLDSPPQMGVFTRNVLAAAQKIIVPMDGGFYSLFGLKLLNNAMPVFRERLNPELEIAGILMTNYSSRLTITRNIYDEVCRTFGSLVFRNSIRQNVSLVEASSMGMSIFEYAPKSKGAECYRDVADELLEKLSVKHEPPAQKTPEPENEPVTFAETQEPENEPFTSEEAPKPEIEPEVTELSGDFHEEPAPEEHPEPEQKPSTPPLRNPYEESIMLSVLDMLPDNRRPMWKQILGSVSSITRGEIDAPSLREDFENADKERYKFYVLNDERDSFWPVSYPDQIIDPMRCVMKFDEYDGSAEVYI
ncbi:MAG: ParA family protein [Synergistaceae bacterium]|nr:ParA family protein [Synergistaceae bacterium]